MPFYLSLWFLLPAFPSGATTLPWSELATICQEVTEVAETESPIPFPDAESEHEERVRTAAIALTWAWGEGGFRTDPGGDACGVGQMFPLRKLGEPSCEVLRHDRVRALRAMVRRMRGDVVACGSVRGGLRRYSSGSCERAGDLVDARCSWSGACGH